MVVMKDVGGAIQDIVVHRSYLLAGYALRLAADPARIGTSKLLAWL
jgi:hypothetical protein